jgi:hypothetical protein
MDVEVRRSAAVRNEGWKCARKARHAASPFVAPERRAVPPFAARVRFAARVPCGVPPCVVLLALPHAVLAQYVAPPAAVPVQALHRRAEAAAGRLR